MEGCSSDGIIPPPGRNIAWLSEKNAQRILGFLAGLITALSAVWLSQFVSWPLNPAMGAAAKLVLSAVVISLAGFAQGLTGFGFGLVAIALLPLLMSLKEAVALAALLNLVVCGMTFLSVRAHYSWRQGLSLVLGACLGVPLGTYLLVHLDEVSLLRGLGTLMLLFSANDLMLRRARSFHLSPRLGFPFGLLSGGLSGAFGAGGPPAIAFTYSQNWSKEQIVAVLQTVFGLSAIVRLLLLGSAGLLASPLLTVGLWSVLPLIGAIGLGQRFFSRIPQPVLKRATFSFLGAMGLKYLVFP
jgi:uncharacterized membrane protein YfcA